MRKITLLFCWLLFSKQMVSQSYVEIGTTNPSPLANSDLPFFEGYNKTYSQDIYLANEINSSGYITGISWLKNVGVTPLSSAANSKVYLGMTSKSSFSNTDDWIPISQLSQVYSGSVAGAPNSWITINFQTPFYYDGSQNLVVVFLDDDGNFNSGNGFQNYVSGTNRSIFYRFTSASSFSINNPPSATSLSNLSASTRLSFNWNENCSSAFDLRVGMTFNDFPINAVINNAYLTDSGALPTPSCGNYAGSDVWYKLQMPSNGQVTIETDGTSGDTAIEAYSNACGSLAQIACDNDSGNAAFSRLDINNPALANQTIYVRVWEPNNDNIVQYKIAAWSSTLPVAASNCLNFDGNNDYVSGPNISLVNNSFSVEFWAKRNSATGNTFLVSQGTNSNNSGLTIGFNATNNFVFGFTANDLVTTSTITDNSWHHYAVTYNALTKKQSIFIDGILATTRNSSSNFIGVGNLNIGGIYNGSNPFNGNIDELRIWDYELTNDDVLNRKNCELNSNESGLSLYYKFNQGYNGMNNTSQVNLFDSKANVNNGTLTNFELLNATSNFITNSPVNIGSLTATEPIVNANVLYAVGATAVPLTATGSNLIWYATPIGGAGSSVAPTPSTATSGITSYWVSSNAGSCESSRKRIDVLVGINPASHLNFDGVNDKIVVPNVNFSNQSFSIEFWARRTGGIGDNQRFIVSQGATSTHGGLGVGFRTSNKLAMVFWNDDLESNSVITDNSWHHYAVTYNAVDDIQRIYIDGLLDAYRGTNGDYNASGNFIIGNLFNNISPYDYPYNGDLEELRVWNKELSIEEINGRRYCELNGNETNLLLYYKFNQGYSGANNTTQFQIFDTVSNSFNAPLSSFALSGNSSNWLYSSPVTTGSTLPVAPSANNQTFCGAPTVADLVPSPSSTIVWYNSATSITPLLSSALLTNGQYYVATKNTNGCESARIVITATLTPPPTVTPLISYFVGQTASPLTATGTNLLWYTAATGGTGTAIAPTPPTAVVGTYSYYVSQTPSSCESPRSRIDVVVSNQGSHLNFDGSDDRIIGPNINIANQSFSVEFWARRTAGIGDNQRFIFSQGTTSSSQGLGIGFRTTNKLAFIFWNDDLESNAQISDTNWHHYALTYDAVSNTQKIYIDGVLDNSRVTSADYQGSGNVIIGNLFNNISPYNFPLSGELDELRIWSKEISITEINNYKNCELVGNETDLKLYYKFNQGYAGGNNTLVSTSFDSVTGTSISLMQNFSLTGHVSNWLDGSPIVNDSTCVTLSGNEFEETSDLFKIYPNPFVDSFKIEIDKNAILTLTDVTGKILKVQELLVGENNIHLDSDSRGVYFAKLQNEKMIKTIKIVKK